jgi:hypothetical protein
MTRTKLLAAVLVLVALGGIATQAVAVQPPTPAQMDGAGNQEAGAVTVTDMTAPESAAPGEEVTVTATLENPTDRAQAERVELRLGGEVVERTTVILEAGGTTTVRLSFNTTGSEPGEYVYAVFAESDGAVGELTLSESFELNALEAPDSVTVGDSVTVDATVTNPNEFTTTQPVELRVGGLLFGSTDVTLDPGSSTTVAFELPTDEFDPDEYTHGVFTRDDGALARLTLTATAETPASVGFENQTSNGTTVTVANATLPEDGYVVVHDSSLLDGAVVDSVIGVSAYQEAGTYENLSVTLYDVPGATFNATELTANETLVAMPHEETGTNTTYDFVRTNGTQDGPFVADGEAVVDAGLVPLTTATQADNGTASTAAGENTTAGDGAAGNG